MGEVYRSVPVPSAKVPLGWMFGRPVCEVTFDEPNWWRLVFSADDWIGIQCLWRIVQEGRLVRTAEDHRQWFGLPEPVDAARDATSRLAGRRVSDVRLRDDTADLTLEFEEGLRLEIVTNSAGYESWEFRNSSGDWYIATGGGRMCRAEKQAGPAAPHGPSAPRGH